MQIVPKYVHVTATTARKNGGEVETESTYEETQPGVSWAEGVLLARKPKS